MAEKINEKLTEALTLLFEGFFELKEQAENDYSAKNVEEEDDFDDEEMLDDIDSAVAVEFKKAFEAVLDAEDYTPNDIADLMSVMTEALQEIAPDVFEDGDDDEDGDEDDYEEEDLDEDLDDDFGYDDEDE